MSQKKLMLLGGTSYLIPVIETAHRLGFYVITADYIPDNVAHNYSDEYINVSIVDKDLVLKYAKEKNIQGIMSFGVDPGVVTAAYVAENMQLPFQCSYNAACILQDKFLFRSYLKKHNFNTPKARRYDNVDAVLDSVDSFTWPIIVKPVDSAGSKGVTRVDSKHDLETAVIEALGISISKQIIIEEYLDVVGYQSSADVFVINGNLVYPVFSDQIFDSSAANPLTPAIEIWPSSMAESIQNELNAELQRLFNLLGIRSGIFNVETRLCSDGKAYLMEVSPRGGGNRIAELETLATGVDLIKCEIQQAMGEPIENIAPPIYNGVWCNYIIHSSSQGVLKTLDIDDDFRHQYIISESYNISPGESVFPFTGANTSLGTLFLRTETRCEMNQLLTNIKNNVKILLVQ